jgi:hypothetical protein
MSSKSTTDNLITKKIFCERVRKVITAIASMPLSASRIPLCTWGLIKGATMMALVHARRRTSRSRDDLVDKFGARNKKIIFGTIVDHRK